jgi:hypothetical protein
MITHERLREALHYDPPTGAFIWRGSCTPRLIGKRAGCKKDFDGYRVIKVDGRRYYEHRLAWFYMTAEWPKELDHCDLDKSNNAWTNLRLATRTGNSANRTLRRDNTSGFKGVSFDPRDGRWDAKLMLNGKYMFIGRFRTKEEAGHAYMRAAQQSFGEFARAI